MGGFLRRSARYSYLGIIRNRARHWLRPVPCYTTLRLRLRGISTHGNRIVGPCPCPYTTCIAHHILTPTSFILELQRKQILTHYVTAGDVVRCLSLRIPAPRLSPFVYEDLT
jgi:hypothetical protein